MVLATAGPSSIPHLLPYDPEGATLAADGGHGDAMTVTDERPPEDALPAGPGWGIAPSDQDPPQPGQYAVFEESEALEPDPDLADPAIEQDVTPGRLGMPVLATPKAITATQVINEARGHLGWQEGANNDNPFWVWLPGGTWLRHASYCASAASYCFWKVGGASPGLAAIYGGHYNCAEWVTTFQRHSHFYRSGQRGDLVFYDWSGAKRNAEHVGIVESVDSKGNVTAVEFNTSPGTGGSQSNGGGCYRRTRGPWCIVGYGRPGYGPEGNVNPTPPDPSGKKIILTVDGVWGVSTNRRLQQWLGLPVDGVMGPQTRKAVQRAIGVTADGVWGPATHKALQKMVGVPQDGVWGRNTVRALQRYLNAAGLRRGVRVTADDTIEPGTGVDLLIALLNALFERLLGNGAGKHASEP